MVYKRNASKGKGPATISPWKVVQTTNTESTQGRGARTTVEVNGTANGGVDEEDVEEFDSGCGQRDTIVMETPNSMNGGVSRARAVGGDGNLVSKNGQTRRVNTKGNATTRKASPRNNVTKSVIVTNAKFDWNMKRMDATIRNTIGQHVGATRKRSTRRFRMAYYRRRLQESEALASYYRMILSAEKFEAKAVDAEGESREHDESVDGDSEEEVEICSPHFTR
jgi:hypothetical protein